MPRTLRRRRQRVVQSAMRLSRLTTRLGATPEGGPLISRDYGSRSVTRLLNELIREVDSYRDGLHAFEARRARTSRSPKGCDQKRRDQRARNRKARAPEQPITYSWF